MPNGRNIQPPNKPQVSAVSKVGEPAHLVMLAPNYGTIPDTQGKDDLYTNPPSHPQAYMNVRKRHNGGANFAFADGHAKWFPGPPDYRARSQAGIVWQHCAPPKGTADAGWFLPLAGTVPATNCS